MKSVCSVGCASFFVLAFLSIGIPASARGFSYEICKIDSTLECPKADNFYCRDSKDKDIECDASDAKIRVCVYGNDSPYIPASWSCIK